jgi:hypothetical protein
MAPCFVVSAIYRRVGVVEAIVSAVGFKVTYRYGLGCLLGLRGSVYGYFLLPIVTSTPAVVYSVSGGFSTTLLPN